MSARADTQPGRCHIGPVITGPWSIVPVRPAAPAAPGCDNRDGSVGNVRSGVGTRRRPDTVCCGTSKRPLTPAHTRRHAPRQVALTPHKRNETRHPARSNVVKRGFHPAALLPPGHSRRVRPPTRPGAGRPWARPNNRSEPSSPGTSSILDDGRRSRAGLARARRLNRVPACCRSKHVNPAGRAARSAGHQAGRRRVNPRVPGSNRAAPPRQLRKGGARRKGPCQWLRSSP
jgi:hypothetical protein